MLGILENHRSFNSWIPKIGKVTFDVSMVHFLLMFGYKLFSLYYPLFLVSIGLSLVDVGSVYLITYSSIALFSVVIDYYIHRFNPILISVGGILGYGIFSCMMLFNQNHIVFYMAQVILGCSAAAWMVSLRLILMESDTAECEKKFGWFYSMPNYAAVIAPVVGGFVIWKFGFVGVFSLSVIIHAANAIYAYFSLSTDARFVQRKARLRKKNAIGINRLLEILGKLRRNNSLLLFSFSFILSLMIVGIYRAFLSIFLEDLSFPREKIIQIISISSLVYLPLSFYAIKVMEGMRSFKIAHGGILIEGLSAIFLSLFAPILNVFGVLAIMIMDSFGVLLADTGKSSFLSEKFKDFKEEASTIDTIISTLFPALGSLAGGIMISLVGYQNTFLAMGIIVFISGLISFLIFSRKNVA